MPKPITTPDRLFDRTWRPGHPFRPRLSGRRKWVMTLLFLFLCAIIAGYAILTDSHRVRAMAQSYLSKFIGGRVEIGKANLSIFEGLRLDDVKVYAEDADANPSRTADPVIFSAATFLIQTRPRALLEGRVEAQRIVVIDPHVSLVEDLDSRQWNYQLLRPQRRTAMPRAS